MMVIDIKSSDKWNPLRLLKRALMTKELGSTVRIMTVQIMTVQIMTVQIMTVWIMIVQIMTVHSVQIMVVQTMTVIEINCFNYKSSDCINLIAIDEFATVSITTA